MKRKEEAISRIQRALSVPNRLQGLVLIDEESANMAIEALSVEAEEAVLNKMLEEEMIVLPQDYVKVVRCKDCCHRVHDEERHLYYCEKYYGQGDVSDENFCQWGERREL